MQKLELISDSTKISYKQELYYSYIQLLLQFNLSENISLVNWKPSVLLRKVGPFLVFLVQSNFKNSCNVIYAGAKWVLNVLIITFS